MPPRRTRNYGPRRSKPGAGKAWLVGLLSVTTIAALLATAYLLRTVNVTEDTLTLVPASGPSAVQAILIDQSDPISQLQVQRLGQILDQVIEQASVGERIDLFVLAHDGTQSLAPVISLCRPKSEGNVL